MKPNDRFWDVGANLGLHALTVAKLRKDVKVIAFEPNPEMVKLIRRAATRNQLDLEIRSEALHHNNSEELFYMHRFNSGRSGLHNWDNNPDLERILVKTSRADNLIKTSHIQKPDVIKLDVEGNEANVLEGMINSLSSTELRKVIFEDSQVVKSRVKQLLTHHGFKVEKLIRTEATEHALSNFVATR